MQKAICSLLLLVGLVQTKAQDLLNLSQPQPQYEVRAVWLTTYSGLDWPARPARTTQQAEAQQKALCQILDQLQAAGINTVLFQARLRGTTAYSSAIEPWDAIFTGTAGKAPTFDPLAFAIKECHRRGMELHAWMVAFPIGNAKAMKSLGRQGIAQKQPGLCRICGDQWMMDPGVPETADYLARLCEEVAKNYDVDGIHLDYIRYPEQSIPWNDRKTYAKYGGGKPLADWRRDNVTRVVRKIHKRVKAVRPWIKMSCSPVGKRADLPRQSSYGWNARDAVWQDAQAWLAEGLMDMLFPMMYFDGRHFYPFAQDWQETSTGKPVVPGLGIYFLSEKEKNWPLSVITRQLHFTRQLHIGGSAHFRSRFLTDNVKGLYDYLQKSFYRQPAKLPPMTWLDSVAPPTPQVAQTAENWTIKLTWKRVKDNNIDVPVSYNVYRLNESAGNHAPVLLATRLDTTAFDFHPTLPGQMADRYVVTAVDAYGNESPLPQVNHTADRPTDGENLISICHDRLTLPDSVEKAPFVLVCDLSGRALLTQPMERHIDLHRLKPGSYELRTLGEKGRSRRIMFFRKTPTTVE